MKRIPVLHPLFVAIPRALARRAWCAVVGHRIESTRFSMIHPAVPLEFCGRCREWRPTKTATLDVHPWE